MQTSPKPYYDALVPEKVTDNRPDYVPILSRIKREIGRPHVIMLVSIALKELQEWFNVKQNITNEQIAFIAEMIVDHPGFHDLTLGNIKACFRHHMMSAKLYDRLDGAIIIQWLREFKSELADYCENVNLGREIQRQREELSGNAGSISHDTYMAMVEARADKGDSEAKEILADYLKRAKILSPEARRKKEFEFAVYREKYLNQQKQHQNGN